MASLYDVRPPAKVSLYDVLAKHFGRHIYEWPTIPRTTPSWWLPAWWRERRINRALATVGLGPITDAMRIAYWSETRKGQDIREDAGSYLWRCWEVALGTRQPGPVETYEQAVMRMLHEADHNVGKKET